VGVGNWELGLAMMAGFGVWGYTILNK
jgi:hypothetical protein